MLIPLPTKYYYWLELQYMIEQLIKKMSGGDVTVRK
jgi:hypothetical protein